MNDRLDGDLILFLLFLLLKLTLALLVERKDEDGVSVPSLLAPLNSALLPWRILSRLYPH